MYSIDVTMYSKFEWMSAANREMPAYKDWILFLFERLGHLNSDIANTVFEGHISDKDTELDIVKPKKDNSADTKSSADD